VLAGEGRRLRRVSLLLEDGRLVHVLSVDLSSVLDVYIHVLAFEHHHFGLGCGQAE